MLLIQDVRRINLLLIISVILNVIQPLLILTFHERCNLLQRKQKLLQDSIEYDITHQRQLQLDDTIKYQMDGNKIC